MHALMIFILATSNVLPVVMQGFYWKQPGNNIVIFPLLCSCNFFPTIAILQSDELLISGSFGLLELEDERITDWMVYIFTTRVYFPVH